MLLALHKRYSTHIKLTKYWSGIFFKYIDKYYTPKKNCPSTKLVGANFSVANATSHQLSAPSHIMKFRAAYQMFKEKVFSKMDKGIQGSVLDLIFRDREGEPVDT